jgi:hypothetical protein
MEMGKWGTNGVDTRARWGRRLLGQEKKKKKKKIILIVTKLKDN